MTPGKDSYFRKFRGFTGYLLFGLGTFIIIEVAYVTYKLDTNFIENTEMFRGVIIGLVLFVGGNIMMAINKIKLQEVLK